MSERYTLHLGDNLEALRSMPDDSIDAIVTDPPYGLSESKGGSKRSLSSIIFEVVFPDLANLYSKRFRNDELPFPRGSVMFLDWALRALRVQPRVTVPECTVDLEGDISGRNEEIETTGEGSIGIPNRVLMNEINAQFAKFSGEYLLSFRPIRHTAFSNSLRSGIRKLGPGRFSMPVIIPFHSSISSLSSSSEMLSSSGICNVVGLGHDSQSQSHRPASVLATFATEAVVMLCFDTTNGTCEILAADGTDQLDAIGYLIPTEFIATGSTTRRLPTEFQPRKVSLIGSTTDRTITVNFHRELLAYINNSRGGFMNQQWDYDVPSVDTWRECLRVLKPGGHLLAFAGTRTQHRMAVNIEDAGFEIRDMIAWVYGSGFPKSHDVSKAIDRDAGAEREVLGTIRVAGITAGRMRASNLIDRGDGKTPDGRDLQNAIDYVQQRIAESVSITAPATDAAKQWQGWGTALKPALEPITVARKPLQGTVASNVLEYGTGGLNIEGCRVGGESTLTIKEGGSNKFPHEDDSWVPKTVQVGSANGRWPANLIHDGSEEVMKLFPKSVARGGQVGQGSGENTGLFGMGSIVQSVYHDKETSAARFFYCAKASNADRNEGLEERNHHPTVKPTDLMRYLCRLVTPPGGLILDPYMGSGSTGKAAMLEGFRFVGCEMEPEYMEIARARIAHAASQVVQEELL